MVPQSLQQQQRVGRPFLCFKAKQSGFVKQVSRVRRDDLLP